MEIIRFKILYFQRNNLVENVFFLLPFLIIINNVSTQFNFYYDIDITFLLSKYVIIDMRSPYVYRDVIKLTMRFKNLELKSGLIFTRALEHT